MRNTLVIVCALAILVWAGPTWGNDWQKVGGDGNWTAGAGANWSDGLPVAVTQQTYATDMGVGAYTITINTSGAATHKYHNQKGVGTEEDPHVLLLEAGGVFDVSNVIWMAGGGSTDPTTYATFRMTGGVGNIAGMRIGGAGYNIVGKVEISGGTILPYYYDKNGDGQIHDAGVGVGDQWGGRGGSFHVIGSASSITVLGGEGALPTYRWSNAFAVQNHGTLIAEIDSGGVTTINADLTQSANLYDSIGDNIGFLTRGEGYDDPVIDMRRQVGIIPDKDQAFVLVTGDCINGINSYARENTMPVLSPEDVGTWELVIVAGTESGLYMSNNGDNGSVTAIWKPAFAGDANADGDVDDSDLSILLSNFGDPGVWSAGEFNADGNIDDSDLSLLLSNFGSVTATTVPEPATLTLLGLGALALIRRRRNK